MSWSIAELQDDLDQVEPEGAAAAAPPSRPADDQAVKSPAARASSEAAPSPPRRPVLRAAWSEPGPSPAFAAESDLQRPSHAPDLGPGDASAAAAPANGVLALPPASIVPSSSAAPDSAVARDEGRFHPDEEARFSRTAAKPRLEDALLPPTGERPVAAPRVRTSSASASLVRTPEKGSSGLMRMLLTAAVAFPLGLVGGVVGARLQAKLPRTGNVPKSAPPQAQATTTASNPEATVQRRATGPSLERFNALVEKLGDTAASVKMLDGRLARLESQKPEPPPDLGPLRSQIEQLSTTADALAPLPRDVRRIDDQLLRLSGALTNLNEEMGALRKKTEKLAAATAREVDRAVVPAAGGASTDAAPPQDEFGSRLMTGARLFRQSRFKEALSVFNRLELTHPEDARVWYYAALCLGFSTGQWTGGTQQLVEKGIERERAGTPVAGVIDATFLDLPPNLGRDWLGEYRRRAAAAAGASPESNPGATSELTSGRTIKD
jgi:hypothetical protein